MIKVYTARGMTGRNKADVVAEAAADKDFLERAGFTVLCPVAAENVKAENKVLNSTKAQMDTYWTRDKEMIREAHLVMDMTPHLKSEGVAHEIGYARYFLWKKVIRVYPLGMLPSNSSVAFYEDDYLTDSLIDAINEALLTHGTPWLRLKWRLKLYNRCLLKAWRYKLQEWTNAVQP